MVCSTDGNLNTCNHCCILSRSVFLDSSDSIACLSKSAMYSVIFLLTSALVVPEKLLRFLSPCSSIYQTTPHQRPSVRLNALPFVSSFFCMSISPFQAQHNTTYPSEYPAKSAENSATPKSARLKFEQPLNCLFRNSLQKLHKPLCGRRCRPLFPARGKQGNPSLSPAYFRTSCKTAVKPPIFRVCSRIRQALAMLPAAAFLRPNGAFVFRNNTPPLPRSVEWYRADCRYALRHFS